MEVFRKTDIKKLRDSETLKKDFNARFSDLAKPISTLERQGLYSHAGMGTIRFGII